MEKSSLKQLIILTNPLIYWEIKECRFLILTMKQGF